MFCFKALFNSVLSNFNAIQMVNTETKCYYILSLLYIYKKIYIFYQEPDEKNTDTNSWQSALIISQVDNWSIPKINDEQLIYHL